MQSPRLTQFIWTPSGSQRGNNDREGEAILRGQHVEAVTAFWAYTMKPLAELLRMRYCAERWDFGMRYLDRDLPPAVYRQVRDLAFIQDLEDLKEKLATASAWGATLLRELHAV
jgi:hypothetical protein